MSSYQSTSSGRSKYMSRPPAVRASETTGEARTHQRLRETERTYLFEARHRWQPLFLLLLRTAQVDGSHRKPAVDSIEGGQRAIDLGNLHRDVAAQQIATAR